MATTVKKSISLAPELARAAEQRPRDSGKKPSAARFGNELKTLQGYWSLRAKERGILTEEDLERYLGTGRS